MSQSKKETRENMGDTYDSNFKNSEAWLSSAKEFNKAAIMLHGGSYNTQSFTYFLNAGISLELILKAIIISKNPNEFKITHNLKDLCKLSQVPLSKDQMFTLELLTEFVYWCGKYPVPLNEKIWDKYHDEILENQIVRENDGTTFKTLANRNRYPSLENYETIWETCQKTYESIKLNV